MNIARKLDMKNSNDTRLALLEQAAESTRDAFQRMEKKLEIIDYNIKVNSHRLDEKIDTQSRWLIGTAISATLALAGIATNFFIRFYIQ